MIAVSVARALNHLLNQQGWARTRLARHAGSRIEFRTPPLPALRFAITEAGLVSPAGDQPGDLSVSISPIALPLLLTRSPQALAHIDMVGPEALAETVKGLLLELDWDLEEDLSRFIGDVAAHGVVQTGRDAYAWQRDSLERLARNFSEYWTEERPLLARRVDFENFARQLQDLQAELARVEGRLQNPKAGPGN
jgi:ubiquinone biosynthesis protein UbiJ